MKYEMPSLDGHKLLTIKDYIKEMGLAGTSVYTITSNIHKGNLDYIEVNPGMFLIVFNEKAQNFKKKRRDGPREKKIKV